MSVSQSSLQRMSEQSDFGKENQGSRGAKGLKHAGLGKGSVKRHRRILRDTIEGITKPAVRRLARRGGVKRISGLIYEETRRVLKEFLTGIIHDAVTYADCARRKTITVLDVVHSLKVRDRIRIKIRYPRCMLLFCYCCCCLMFVLQSLTIYRTTSPPLLPTKCEHLLLSSPKETWKNDLRF